MVRKIFLILIILGFASWLGMAQSFVRTSDLFQRPNDTYRDGQLNIIQDSAIDTLISRYILNNRNLARDPDHLGMNGFRIQIYGSSVRNAREEANKARADFIIKFPGLESYILYAEPGYFKVRVGDFRTKTEATKLFLTISKEFPDAYLVPDFINFPDLNTK